MFFLRSEVEEAAVDICPERINLAALYRVSLETVDEVAVDTCPERMDAADAEAPRPPRIETAVEFWSGLGVETAARTEVGIYPERMEVEETAVLRRFFWRSKKKKQEAADEC